MDYLIIADTDLGQLAAYALEVTDLGTALVRTEEFHPNGQPDWTHPVVANPVRDPAMDQIRALLDALAEARR